MKFILKLPKFHLSKTIKNYQHSNSSSSSSLSPYKRTQKIFHTALNDKGIKHFQHFFSFHFMSSQITRWQLKCQKMMYDFFMQWKIFIIKLTRSKSGLKAAKRFDLDNVNFVSRVMWLYPSENEALFLVEFTNEKLSFTAICGVHRMSCLVRWKIDYFMRNFKGIWKDE